MNRLNSLAQPAHTIAPTVHLYDPTQEAISRDGSVSSLDLYVPRGFNMSQGVYITPKQLKNATQDQSRYLIDHEINQAPAQLLTIETGENTLTEAALSHWEQIKSKIKELGKTQLEPFMHNQNTQKLAELTDIQTPYQSQAHAHQVVENSNNKGHILNHFAQQGLKVPKGRRVDSIYQAQGIFQHLIDSHFPAAFVKITRSASGDGTVCTHSMEQLNNILSQPKFAEALQTNQIYIDGLIPYIQSPSVLFNIDSNGHQILGSNYQILAKKDPSDLVPTVHKGARGPISNLHMNLMQPHIQTAVTYLQNQGYQGQANIEGLLTENNDYYTIEINARQTGSTTPSLESRMIHQRTQSPSFWHCNNDYHVPKNTSYNQLYNELQDILYKSSKDWGVIISNFGIIESGKAQLTIHAPNPDMLNELIQETETRVNNLHE